MAQLSNDCFAFGGELMSVDEAKALIAERIAVAAGVEDVPLIEADGRVLAEDIAAPLDLPPFDNSAVDGYAVRFADLAAGQETVLAVVGRIAAGAALERPVPARGAVRIFTGAPMPAGLDTVFMQEDVGAARRRGRAAGRAQAAGRTGGSPARTSPAAGRRLPPGAASSPQDIGLIAALGIAGVPVRTPLRVAVFSTGDEVDLARRAARAGKALRRQPLHAAGDAPPARLPRDRPRHPARRAARACPGARRRGRGPRPDRHLRRRLDRRGGPRQGGGRERRRADVLAHRHQARAPGRHGRRRRDAVHRSSRQSGRGFRHLRACGAGGDRPAVGRAPRAGRAPTRCWRALPTARRRGGGNMCASGSRRATTARSSPESTPARAPA